MAREHNIRGDLGLTSGVGSEAKQQIFRAIPFDTQLPGPQKVAMAGSR